MKTEDDPSSEFIASVQPVSAASSSTAGATHSSPAEGSESALTLTGPSASTSASVAAAAASSHLPTKRPPNRKGCKKAGDITCDHCRKRRVKCDYKSPCERCIDSQVTCKRTHKPQKRGPKKGQGKVINAIRENERKERQEAEFNSVARVTLSHDGSWRNSVADPRNGPESRSVFTSDQYQPLHRPYLQLISRCVDLYYEHIYPIMPLLYIPAIRSMVQRQMTDPEKNLIYALCALVCMHMSGKSLQVDGPASWEDAGRFFLNECVATRKKYDYMEDTSIETVISSFWLSTSFFEINQDKSSWMYLSEALASAQYMGLHDDSTYIGLSPQEALCRQRVFWILFVTERSYAILRKRPLTLKKTPSLPITRHAYESPDIHTGFLQLVSSYVPLDESFVSAWNDDDSDPRVSATTYLALQNLLAQPPSFLHRSRATTPSSDSNPTYSAPVTAAPSATGSEEEADEEIVHSEPTAIQKADLLITQQWLRLIVWQSSDKQHLLSWHAPQESLNRAFPLEIARSTAKILHSLPSSAVEVHGMGIFEKIFEIGDCCIKALDEIDGNSAARRPMGGTSGFLGMDFIGTGDLGVLGLSRRGIAIDPMEVFVRTLSATPNSRAQFADKLLSRPGIMKMSLTPSLTTPILQPESLSWSTGLSGVSNPLPMGSILGEVVKEENELDTEGNSSWHLGNPLGLNGGGAGPSQLSDPMFDFNTSPFHAAPSNPPSNDRQSALASYSMPSLNTSVQPASSWTNEMSAATQDWSYDLTSPTLGSAPFSTNVSAYSSAAGTPIGNITTNLFSRQDSGDNVYHYQERQQPRFGTVLMEGATPTLIMNEPNGRVGFNGGANTDVDHERAMRARRFLGSL